MNRSCQNRSAGATAKRGGAFTLIELLVVIAIIGILATVGLPALKGFGQSNVVASAQRQMLDDFGAARQRAIAEHTDVYVVFMTQLAMNNLSSAFQNNTLTGDEKFTATNLFKRQFEAYALYTPRSVGDQPGHSTGRYMPINGKTWQNLPDGMMFRTNKFFANSEGVSVCQYTSLPFPLATSLPIQVHCIGFNHLGQLISAARDNGTEIFPLARGSILYDDINFPYNASIIENPRGNSSTNSTTYDWIRIDGLTGRARVERYVMQ